MLIGGCGMWLRGGCRGVRGLKRGRGPTTSSFTIYMKKNYVISLEYSLLLKLHSELRKDNLRMIKRVKEMYHDCCTEFIFFKTQLYNFYLKAIKSTDTGIKSSGVM